MKKIIFASLLSVSILSTQYIQAQTLDEIVAKHIEAIGGVENWMRVNSMIANASMKAQGAEIKLKITEVNKKAMRTDISVMGMNGYTIVTNTEGWNFLPFAGQKKAEPMTADDVKNSQDELQFTDEFITYKKDEKKLELIGKDDVEGTECYKLKMTDKNKKETTFYIDPSNYQVIKQTTKATINGKEQESTSTFSDFKKLPEGIVFPMGMTTGNGEMKFDTVELNGKIDDAIFKPSSKE